MQIAEEVLADGGTPLPLELWHLCAVDRLSVGRRIRLFAARAAGDELSLETLEREMELIGAGPAPLRAPPPAPPAREVSAVATSPDTVAYPAVVHAPTFKALAAGVPALLPVRHLHLELPQRPRALPRAAPARAPHPGRRDRRRAEERRPLALHRVRHLHRRLPHGDRRRRRPAPAAPAGARARRASAAPSARPPTWPRTHLRKRPRIDNLRFGAAMVAKGHVPRDKVGAAEHGHEDGAAAAAGRQEAAGRRRRLPAAGRRHAALLRRLRDPAGPRAARAWSHEVAAGFGVRLDEAADAGCCGHPSRGAVGRAVHGRGHRATRPARPATPASRRPACTTVPLWDALTEQARRTRPRRCSAAAPALRPLRRLPRRPRRGPGRARPTPPSRPAARMELAYPTLHNGCCGALGGMYRGATKASGMLLEFAARAARARRHLLRALPRQPALRRPRAQARRPRPLLARVLPGRPDRPGGPHR